MFKLLVVSLLGLLYGSVNGQYTTAADAFCTLWDATCGYGNANITGAYTNRDDCVGRNDNLTHNVLTCNFYHLGVAYSFSQQNQINNTQTHCMHSAGSAPGTNPFPCNTTMGATVAAQTGAQFCGTVGLFGQGCVPWTNGNRTAAQCEVAYNLAYTSDQLCYTYNAAKRISAGGAFTSDSGNLCLAAGGHAGQTVCRAANFSSPAPTTPAPSAIFPDVITATGITGNYALKSFIILNVPVAIDVCYNAPGPNSLAVILGIRITCNGTNFVETRYFSNSAPAPTAEIADYQACTNTTGNVVTELGNTTYGTCSATAANNNNNYVVALIFLAGNTTSPSPSTSCIASTSLRLAIPVVTGGCVNSGYNPLVGTVWSTMTCTHSSITYSHYGLNTCAAAATIQVITANSTNNCTFVTETNLGQPLGTVSVYLGYQAGACYVNGVAANTPAPTSNANTLTVAHVITALLLTLFAAVF